MSDAVRDSILELREGADSQSGKVQVHGGNDQGDWTITYKPPENGSDGTVVLAIRPSDFERRTAEQIAKEMSGSLGRNTPHLEEEEAGAFVEFIGEVNWTA
jgi:hypothetical protein